VFGIDNVDITLSGKSTPTTALCFGTANQAPGTTLRLRQELYAIVV
jgi:hypothetical protein